MPDNLSDDAVREITQLVVDFFADECEVDASEITRETRVIEDLDGDSLMLLSLLETVRKKHELTIELKTLGGHLMKKPASTVGQVIDLTVAIVRFGDDIVTVEF